MRAGPVVTQLADSAEFSSLVLAALSSCVDVSGRNPWKSGQRSQVPNPFLRCCQLSVAMTSGP
eukprot:2159399-Amphidinium_carterae.1